MTRRGGGGVDGWWGRLRRPGVEGVSRKRFAQVPGRGRRKRPPSTQLHPRPYGKTEPPFLKLVRIGITLQVPWNEQ